MRLTGRVGFYNEAKGWGFIHGDDGQDYFAHVRHIRGLSERQKGLKENERVEFEPAQHPRRGNVAHQVERAGL